MFLFSFSNKTKNGCITFAVSASFVLLLAYQTSSCHSPANDRKPDYSRDTSVIIGKGLANQYCQSCHLLPDPSLLDKKSWLKNVLPGMAPRLGIYEFRGDYYKSSRYEKNIPENYYPDSPLLTSLQWQHIMEYYGAMSPDSLPRGERKEKMISGIPFFHVKFPLPKYGIPSTCYAGIDTGTNGKRIFIADASSKNVFIYDANLILTDSINVSGPVVDIVIEKKGLITCNMGNMNPNNSKQGFLQYFGTPDKKYQPYLKGKKILTQLARPVQATLIDLNQDNKKDFLLCEFGNLAGALVWMEQKPGKKYIRHLLRDAPGPIKTLVCDFNNDGLPDIAALFTQANEGIYLFTNKGNGHFEEKLLLRFPAVFGSTSFELHDFNKDGYPDIVYTCGDNADYSPVLKPYHGVYIYLNDGKFNFTQKFFFPVNGCFKAMARDFDCDGDLDIASISFFTDPAKEEEGFIYLENKGNYTFQPYSLPESKKGHWLTMDVNDADGDGKADILLGNFNFGSDHDKTGPLFKRQTPFLLLKNITSK